MDDDSRVSLEEPIDALNVELAETEPKDLRLYILGKIGRAIEEELDHSHDAHVVGRKAEDKEMRGSGAVIERMIPDVDEIAEELAFIVVAGLVVEREVGARF